MKKTLKKLVLNKDTIGHLTMNDLSKLHGGNGSETCPCPPTDFTCPTMLVQYSCQSKCDQ